MGFAPEGAGPCLASTDSVLFLPYRKPLASLHLSPVTSALRMESGRGSSTLPGSIAALEVPDTGPGSSSLGKLQALPVGPRAHCGDPGSPAAAGNGSLDTGPAGEQSGSLKIPNRDSGIDSPSSSVAGENFPCEEGLEASAEPGACACQPSAPSSERLVASGMGISDRHLQPLGSSAAASWVQEDDFEG